MRRHSSGDATTAKHTTHRSEAPAAQKTLPPHAHMQGISHSPLMILRAITGSVSHTTLAFANERPSWPASHSVARRRLVASITPCASSSMEPARPPSRFLARQPAWLFHQPKMPPGIEERFELNFFSIWGATGGPSPKMPPWTELRLDLLPPSGRDDGGGAASIGAKIPPSTELWFPLGRLLGCAAEPPPSAGCASGWPLFR